MISKDEAILIARKHLLEMHQIQLPLLFATFTAADRTALAYTCDIWTVYFDPGSLEGYTGVNVNAQSGDVQQEDYTNSAQDVEQDFLYLAYVMATVSCPHCGHMTKEILPFQWGSCAIHWICGPDDQPKQTYAIGDILRWRTDLQGEISTWNFRSVAAEMVIGNPKFTNILLLNFETYSFGPCPACGYAEGAAAITVTNGYIAGASLYKPGQFDESTSVYSVNPDGSLAYT